MEAEKSRHYFAARTANRSGRRAFVASAFTFEEESNMIVGWVYELQVNLFFFSTALLTLSLIKCKVQLRQGKEDYEYASVKKNKTV